MHASMQTNQHPRNQAAIVAGGGIPVLVRCLRCASETTAQEAGRVLCGLFSPDDKRAIVGAGGIPALVHLLHSASLVSQYVAAVALHNLSIEGADLKRAIGGAGALPRLVHLLQPSSLTGSGGDGGRASASGSEASGSRASGSGASGSGSGGSGSGSGGSGSGGSGTGGSSSSSGAASGNDSEGNVSRDEVRESAADALCTLCLNCPANQAAIAAAGGVPALVALVRHPSDSLQIAGLGALRNLAHHSPENILAIAAAGGVEAMEPLLCSREPQLREDAKVLLSVVRNVLAYSAVASYEAIAASLFGGGAGQARWAQGQHAAAAQAQPYVPAAPAAPAASAAAGGATGRASAGAAGAAAAAGSAAAAAAAAGAAGAAAAAAAAGAAGDQARGAAPHVCAAEGCSETHGLRRCGGCATARYCGQACSRAHWPAHKPECRRMQAAAAAASEVQQP